MFPSFPYINIAIYERSDSCQGSVEEKVTVRRGFLELMDTMPQADSFSIGQEDGSKPIIDDIGISSYEGFHKWGYQW